MGRGFSAKPFIRRAAAPAQAVRGAKQQQRGCGKIWSLPILQASMCFLQGRGYSYGAYTSPGLSLRPYEAFQA